MMESTTLLTLTVHNCKVRDDNDMWPKKKENNIVYAFVANYPFCINNGDFQFAKSSTWNTAAPSHRN